MTKVKKKYCVGRCGNVAVEKLQQRLDRVVDQARQEGFVKFNFCTLRYDQDGYVWASRDETPEEAVTRKQKEQQAASERQEREERALAEQFKGRSPEAVARILAMVQSKQ